MKARLSHIRFVLYAAFVVFGFVTAGTFEPKGIDAAGFYSPSIESIRVSTSAYGADVNPLNLIAGSNTTFHVNGTISDMDGYGDIATVQAYFYRSSIGPWCSSDTNYCYHHPACALANGSGASVDYDCELSVAYFADSTDDSSSYASDTWNAYIYATDYSNYNAVRGDYTNEINSLRAIATSGAITYGNLGLGQATSSPRTLSIINQGNTPTSAEFSSTGMTCVFGTVPPTAQKFDTVWRSYASMQYTLSTTPINGNIFLAQQTDDYYPQTTWTYWQIQVPTIGVSGDCSGYNTVTAVSL